MVFTKRRGEVVLCQNTMGKSKYPGPGLSFMSVQHTQYAIFFNAARQFQRLTVGLFCTMSSGLPGLFQDIARAMNFIRVKYIRILYTILFSPLSSTVIFTCR